LWRRFSRTLGTLVLAGFASLMGVNTLTVRDRALSG